MFRTSVAGVKAAGVCGRGSGSSIIVESLIPAVTPQVPITHTVRRTSAYTDGVKYRIIKKPSRAGGIAGRRVAFNRANHITLNLYARVKLIYG